MGAFGDFRLRLNVMPIPEEHQAVDTDEKTGTLTVTYGGEPDRRGVGAEGGGGYSLALIDDQLNLKIRGGAALTNAAGKFIPEVSATVGPELFMEPNSAVGVNVGVTCDGPSEHEREFGFVPSRCGPSAGVDYSIYYPEAPVVDGVVFEGRVHLPGFNKWSDPRSSIIALGVGFLWNESGSITTTRVEIKKRVMAELRAERAELELALMKAWSQILAARDNPKSFEDKMYAAEQVLLWAGAKGVRGVKKLLPGIDPYEKYLERVGKLIPIDEEAQFMIEAFKNHEIVADFLYDKLLTGDEGIKDLLIEQWKALAASVADFEKRTQDAINKKEGAALPSLEELPPLRERIGEFEGRTRQVLEFFDALLKHCNTFKKADAVTEAKMEFLCLLGDNSCDKTIEDSAISKLHIRLDTQEVFLRQILLRKEALAINDAIAKASSPQEKKGLETRINLYETDLSQLAGLATRLSQMENFKAFDRPAMARIKWEASCALGTMQEQDCKNIRVMSPPQELREMLK